MQWISHSPEETQALGAQLLVKFSNQNVFCLRGPLGSGKTHFAKGIGQSLGIAPEQIKSPTFTTLMEHRGEKMLYHCDFYRWNEGKSRSPIDWWEDLLERSGIIVAEWSERIEEHLPSKRLEIEFETTGENKRTLIIQAYS